MKTITGTKPIWCCILILSFLVIYSCSVSKPGSLKDIRHISKTNSRQYKERELACIKVKRIYPAKNYGIIINDQRENRSYTKRTRKKSNSNSVYSFDVTNKRVISGFVQNADDTLSLLKPLPSNTVTGKAVWTNFQSINTGQTPVLYNQADPIKDIIPEVSQVNVSSKNNPLKIDTVDEAPQRPDPGKERLVYLAALITGLLSFLGIKKSRNFSTQLASWAYLNPWKTRLIISVIHLIMGTAAVMLGKQLASDGISLSNQTRDIFLATFTASALLYPVRKSRMRLFKDSFLRKKLHNIFMVLSASVLMLFAGNHGLVKVPAFVDNSDASFQQVRMENSVTKESKVFSARWNQHQDPPERSKRPLKKSDRTILTILLVLGFLASGYGLFILSCSLACNGLEALAYVVGIGGGALLIFGLVMGLKGIKHLAGKEKQSKI